MKLEMEQSMSDNIMRKDDPRYIEATIKHSPSLKDPLERQIKEIIEKEVISTPFAEDMVNKLRDYVISNWKDAYSHLNQPDYVHDLTQKGNVETAEIMNSKIISGEENVRKLKEGNPIMIVSNHLATFKLISMNEKELREMGVTGPVLDIYYPYIGFTAPFCPITKILKDNIYEAAVEAPVKLGEIFRATGNIDVPPRINGNSSGENNNNGEEGRADVLTESLRDLMARHQNAAFVIFPEGGTTGKRSGGKIYSLENFKKGSFVIAAKLGLPILPVVQYFNPNSGFELGALEPFVPEDRTNYPEAKSKEYYGNIAESTRGKMQNWLDQRRQAI